MTNVKVVIYHNLVRDGITATNEIHMWA